jgi:hypothetical protein
MDPLLVDLSPLRLAPSSRPTSKRRGRRPAAEVSRLFLKGPIPLAWLARAAKLPGKGFHVGILLWFLKGLRRSSEVSLTSSWLATFGLQRVSVYRAVQALEASGLVTVQRQRGRAPIVRLVVPEDHE